VRRLSIDPITRLEGHGRIDLFLDDEGRLADCYLVVPELRGFEKFLEGRPVEELPRITTRICGVCPEAHHAASVKAVEAVYGITPPPAAQRLRELQYNAFVAGDHATHFYALGGPDFIVGPDAPPAERNLLGVIRKVGPALAGQVVAMRAHCHEVAELLGGRRVHPVGMVPGGQSVAATAGMQARLREIGDALVEFALQTQTIFADLVLGNPAYLELIRSEAYRDETHYMSLVDDDDRVAHYDGHLRVVGPDGALMARFSPASYLDHLAEHVEPWSYLKFPYLKAVGWPGMRDGPDSGVYRVGPLGMLNGATGMQTLRAQAEYEKLYETLGGAPVHHTLAFHWARIIEMLQAAELVARLSRHEDLTDPRVRITPESTPRQGVGCVEAPRGVLIHHYVTNEHGIIERANLLVGTNHNHGGLQLSVRRAAEALIRGGEVPAEPVLNQIEMAFRAYDPCLACATHALPGTLPLPLHVHGPDGRRRQTIRRSPGGRGVPAGSVEVEVAVERRGDMSRTSNSAVASDSAVATDSEGTENPEVNR
jgi:F420-non-reducing hydrogenase large subunit